MSKPCYYVIPVLFALSLMALLSQPSFAQTTIESDSLEKQTEQFNAAMLAANRGELEQAFQLWQSLQESGDLVPALQRAVENNLAVVLIKQKQFAQAKKRLDLALKADPQVATTLDNLNQLYAYEAQQTYHKIFNQPPARKPNGQWLYFKLDNTSARSENIVTTKTIQDDMRLVKGRTEQWRQSWANQNIKNYLAFYDKQSFIPKRGMSYATWKKSRYRSVQGPKFINIFLDDLQVIPITDSLMRVEFFQRYESDRFKDGVKKALLWKKSEQAWKIIQEVVIYAKK